MNIVADLEKRHLLGYESPEVGILAYELADLTKHHDDLLLQGDAVNAEILWGLMSLTADKREALRAEIESLDRLRHCPEELGAMSDRNYRLLRRRINELPEDFEGRWVHKGPTWGFARTRAFIGHRLRSLPCSNRRHVVIHGRLYDERKSDIQSLIGGRWSPLPRLPMLLNQKKPNFAKLALKKMAPDAPRPFYGIDPSDKRYQLNYILSTSIICGEAELAKLMMADMVILYRNIEPEFEEIIDQGFCSEAACRPFEQ